MFSYNFGKGFCSRKRWEVLRNEKMRRRKQKAKVGCDFLSFVREWFYRVKKWICILTNFLNISYQDLYLITLLSPRFPIFSVLFVHTYTYIITLYTRQYKKTHENISHFLEDRSLSSRIFVVLWKISKIWEISSSLQRSLKWGVENHELVKLSDWLLRRYDHRFSRPLGFLVSCWPWRSWWAHGWTSRY